MITIAWWFTRAQSGRRLVAIAGCGAVASAVLLVVVSLLLLPSSPSEALFEVVADGDTRGGVVLALLLLLAPLVVLAHQLVLLGSSTRTQRLAVLRVSGATPRQAGLIGAIAPAVPAATGAVLGIVLYGLLRATIGGGRAIDEAWTSTSATPEATRLIPTSVTPAWWQVVAVVLAVTAVVGLLGWRVSRPAATAPVNTARQAPAAPPRPWAGLALIVLGVGGSLSWLFVGDVGSDSTAVLLVLIGVAAVGLLVLGPWIAAGVGRLVGRSTTSAAVLLGAGRLVLDPRSAGRAAAPVAVIGLVAGGTGQILAMLVAEQMLEAFYVISILLVIALLLIGLTFVAFALAAQSVETLSQHRRSTAALAASGLPAELTERSLRAEALLVAMPTSVAGVLLGGGCLLALAGTDGDPDNLLGAALLGLGGAVLIMVIIVAVAVVAAVRLVRPWLRRAMSPENLRTT